MKILLIGNFAPPYEEESLHNISLYKRLSSEGNECSVINISENMPKEKGFIHSGGYIDFVLKLISHAWGRDVIHFFTKGYLRLGLLKLMTAILIGRLFGARTVITLHSEFFSIMGQMRSPVGGRQTLFTSFAFAHRIICQDRDTYDVANIFKRRHNIVMIPSFICIPDEAKGHGSRLYDKIKDKKRVIIFTNLQYPSLLFDIMDNLLNIHQEGDIGIIASIAEKPSIKLQHVLEERARGLSKRLIFIEDDNIPSLIEAYSKADIIIRPMSCEGKPFFVNFTVSMKMPVSSEGYIYFPNSLLLVKEGETADLCAHTIYQILTDKIRYLPKPPADDFYKRIMDIYSVGGASNSSRWRK
ncbi:MAG: hypothetical protein Fur0020_09050 [Thermodesulfovibrionia bacterium]